MLAAHREVHLTQANPTEPEGVDEQCVIKPTWMVANTLHISNKAKATAKTAPMTLTITAMAFISDGQSTMEMQRKHF